MATQVDRRDAATLPTDHRRGFFRRVADHLSGGFVLGTLGGAGVGAAAMRQYDWKQGTIGNTSYAQQGEDLVLWNMFEYLGVQKPTYIDIGAYDPVEINNTYLFYSRGCHGVLVEPNPARWDRLASVRPRDVLMRAGIGTTDDPETEADFYVIGGGPLGNAGADLSTFSKEEADAIPAKTGGKHYVREVIKMKLINVNKAIRDHFDGKAPNLVSIDVEGLDLDILKTFDFKSYRPEIFCVEMPPQTRNKTIEFLAGKDYVFRGGTFVNGIFFDKRFCA
jgi:hypothetical protein